MADRRQPAIGGVAALAAALAAYLAMTNGEPPRPGQGSSPRPRHSDSSLQLLGIVEGLFSSVLWRVRISQSLDTLQL
ncbi:hypothetical protein NL676_036733 [Syzygium grande]|nr:hypothetical protein NL676_036733 [Syzygium grande]